MKKAKLFFFSLFVFFFYRVWISTWRLRVREPEVLKKDLKDKNPIIFAFWHGEILGIIPFCKYYPVVSMASISQDGEIIKNVIEWLGIKAARGSSSKKGAQGLKQILRIAKDGLIPVMPVDGPRGPIHVPKPGVFEISKILGAKIYPGRIVAKNAFILKSWDRTAFPLPFSKVFLYWGEPLDIIAKDADPREEGLKNSLILSLNASGQSAVKEFDNV